MMVHAKNYETVSTFVKVMQKKPWPLFSDTVYIIYVGSTWHIPAVRTRLLRLGNCTTCNTFVCSLHINFKSNRG